MSLWRGPRHVRHLADGVDAPSCITSRYHPKEKLKLRVRSSRRRKALLQLFLALGERCTGDATARARNGDRDRDRGRPVLLVRPVRVVAVTSSILAILNFFLSPRVRLHTLQKSLYGDVRNALAAVRSRSEFQTRRPYLTSRRRRSRCAAPRRRPTNEATCRRVESSSFRGKSCRQGSSYFKLNRDVLSTQ